MKDYPNLGTISREESIALIEQALVRLKKPTSNASGMPIQIGGATWRLAKVLNDYLKPNVELYEKDNSENIFRHTEKKEMENQEFDTTEHDDATDDARVLSDEAFKIIHDCKEIETQIRAVAMVVGKMTEVIFKQSPFIMPHYQYLEEAIMEESVYGKIRAGLTVEGYEDLKPEDAV